LILQAASEKRLIFRRSQLFYRHFSALTPVQPNPAARDEAGKHIFTQYFIPGVLTTKIGTIWH